MSDATGEIPMALLRDLAMRDSDPLLPNDFLRFQHISIDPDIDQNFRFVLTHEGSLFYAKNSAEPPIDPMAVYNVAMPDEVSAELGTATIALVEQHLAEVEFFSLPPYIAEENARGGSVMIVTARNQDGEPHEVWFRSVNNELTDYLYNLSPDNGEDKYTDILDQFRDLYRNEDDE